MDELVKLAVNLVTQIVALFSAGDAEKERQAMLHISSALSDAAFKRASGK